MKQLVTKAVFVTLGIILAICMLISTIFFIFFPLSLARLFENLGSYSASMYFYQKQYENTNSIEDLYVLCTKVDIYNDEQDATQYLSDMVTKKEYQTFCISKDVNGYGISTEEMIEGKYIVAQYNANGLSSALELGSNLVSNEYSENNPFRMLITDRKLNFSKVQLQQVKDAIEKLSVSPEDKVNIDNDLTYLNGKINNL